MQIKAIPVDGIPNGWDVIEFSIDKARHTETVKKQGEITVRVDTGIVDEYGAAVLKDELRPGMVEEDVVTMVDKEVRHSKNRMFCREDNNSAEAAIAMLDEIRNPAPIDPAVLLAAEVAEALSRRQQQAWQLKQSILAEPVEFDSALFRYDADDKLSIMNTLQEAAILDMPDSESMQWRLVEGVRVTTLSDLKEVVRLGALRRREVETSYTTWKQTDMTTAFNYS